MTRHDACALAAVALAACVYFHAIGSQAGMNEHECYVAQTAREMLTTGDWIVPHFSTVPRVRKTPLAYWTVAALSCVSGRPVDEFAARLPSALAAIGIVLCAWQM